MADFDDSRDPVLGAACNRLAAFVLPLAEGMVVDRASGLTESDLALILRALYDRRLEPSAGAIGDETPPPSGVTVPVTRRGPWA